MSTSRALVLVLLVLSTVGCFGVEDGDGDGDDEKDTCPADLPPPSVPCLAGQCGNELGVGRPCTEGGGQCDVFNLFAGEAGICIPDFADNTQVHACSKSCSVDDDCGAGALCFPDPRTGQLGCVIRGCEGL